MNMVSPAAQYGCPRGQIDRLRHLLAILVAAQTESENLQAADIAAAIEQITIDLNFMILDQRSFSTSEILSQNFILA